MTKDNNAIRSNQPQTIIKIIKITSQTTKKIYPNNKQMGIQKWKNIKMGYNALKKIKADYQIINRKVRNES